MHVETRLRSPTNWSFFVLAGWRRNQDSDIFEVLLPEGDDYKLVFLSSDSSSKEEDDSSSTTSSFPIDDCDWDYFEPSGNSRPLLSLTSPFGSPRVYRRTLQSPLSSPIVCRRSKDSDGGTDEDMARLDSGSPASSDGFFNGRSSKDVEEQIVEDPPLVEDVSLQCAHQGDEIPFRNLCQSCGSPTQYVPIPVSNLTFYTYFSYYISYKTPRPKSRHI